MNRYNVIVILVTLGWRNSGQYRVACVPDVETLFVNKDVPRSFPSINLDQMLRHFGDSLPYPSPELAKIEVRDVFAAHTFGLSDGAHAGLRYEPSDIRYVYCRGVRFPDR